MGISYRPEIDGLRAISVVAVVLYHAGVGGAGFVGVDVFFVISGYLITSLLLAEWNRTKSIDMMSFYARRVRRILPAVVVVTVATVAASAFLLSPSAFAQTANSAGAAMAFVANIFFQATTGSYFDGSAEEMPLLHLWSLSVEEQFYLFWPVVLLLILRFNGKWLRILILSLGTASFLLSQYLVMQDPETAFYQMPSRFWELAAGGLIAVSPPSPAPRWVAPLGLAVLGVAIVVVVEPFPAIGAFPVVMGASLVIAALHGGATNRLLAAKPMVAIGLVSYSLYLWHWPLLALYRATSIGEGSQGVRLGLCVLALVLAILSYRYIEQPIRQLRPGARKTALVGGLTAIAVAVLSLGLAARPGMKVDHPLAARAENDFPPRVCHSKALDRTDPQCQRRPSTRVGIWGDSMAYAWTPAVWMADSSAIALTRDGCEPFLGYLPPKPNKAAVACRDFNNLAARRVVGLQTLVLVALWDSRETGRIASLGPTLDAVAPVVGQVIVIGPTPTMRDEVPECIRQERLPECAIRTADFDQVARPILAELRKLASAHSNVMVVDPREFFCNPTSCPPIRDGVPLYWDSHHISMSVARTVKLPGLSQVGGHGAKPRVQPLD